MTNPSYRAWLVDLDGTLYHPTPVKFSMAAGLVAFGGIRTIRWVRVFRGFHERLRQEETSSAGGSADQLSTPFELQLSRAADDLGVSTEELREVVETWMIRRPLAWIRRFKREALLEELAAFKRSGGRLALVSDYPAREKLDALGAGDLFDCVVASGEPGGPELLKPHPDGMLKAARALGELPEACLVIGDRTDADGEAARRAGMAFRLIR